MKPLTLIIFITMTALACKQTPIEEKPDPRKEITQVILDFQDLLNNSGFTKVFYLATEVPYSAFEDETFYNKALEAGVIDEDTDILNFGVNKILSSNLISEEYKGKIKDNRDRGLDFSFWKDNSTIGAILTDSEFGLDFRGPTFWNISTRENFRISAIAMRRYKNGFAPNPDSIMLSYDISVNEVYQHFIEITSPTTASYYINYKLIKSSGEAPRFIMDFVYSADKGWQIDNMYYDDYKGNILKKDMDFSDVQ